MGITKKKHIHKNEQVYLEHFNNRFCLDPFIFKYLEQLKLKIKNIFTRKQVYFTMVIVCAIKINPEAVTLFLT